MFFAITGCKGPSLSPKFRQDLRPDGFFTEAQGQIVGSFTDLNFLSNDLVLVSINQTLYESIQPSSTDQPPSKLLLFDISRKTQLKTLTLPIEKNVGSVRATREGKFVVLSESGLLQCSSGLECGSSIPARGPLLASPKAERLIVGTNKMEQLLLDGASLKELERFPNTMSVVPGDSGLLIQRDRKLFVRLPRVPERLLPFEVPSFGRIAQFLNDETIGAFDTYTTFAVAKLDGNVSYHVQVLPWWDGTTLATSGFRFCVHETGYTRWNSMIHFYDIEKSRPRNLERVRVFDIVSGKLSFELAWDPRPYVGYLVAPALSPNGRMLAIIRFGILEVYEISNQ